MADKELARRLRKRQTDAERLLWYRLRNRQFARYKFRRQYVIGNYIVDFVCLEHKLVIELDGGQHIEQAGHDAKRSDYLSGLGFSLLRFWNDEILKETDSVLEAILRKLRTSLSLSGRGTG